MAIASSSAASTCPSVRRTASRCWGSTAPANPPSPSSSPARPRRCRQRIASPDLAVGYFAQQQLEQLNAAESAFWHVRNLGGPDYARCEEQAVRDHLGSFGFSGDRVFEPIGVFSGGEKARLTLALIVARRPNLLLLDEPTNHLDIEMRHALTVALQSFEGGMVVVSHDRHLIKMVADSLYLVADGRVQPFEGDLEDYQRWLKDRGKQSRPPEPAAAPPKPKHTAEGTAAPPNPQRQKATLQRELIKLEEKLARLQAELTRLDASLAGPGMHELSRAAEARQLGAKRAELTALLERTEAKWLEVGTELDSARD
ncbi:MAG: ATP-binding cassette domain-containing protein [Steroidobacteraceae bacterium]